MKNIRKQETSVSAVTETCVQPDRHQSLSRQSPVSVATESSLCQPSSPLIRRCRCCRRELPFSEFYLKGPRHTPDTCCKQCRREAGRLYRKALAGQPLPAVELPPRYPVITRTEDPELRRKLIMDALQVVRASVLRRRKRRYGGDEEGEESCGRHDSFI